MLILWGFSCCTRTGWYLFQFLINVDLCMLHSYIFIKSAGDVELNNMQLKPEALNALKLPVKVKAGFLGSVKLKVCPNID